MTEGSATSPLNANANPEKLDSVGRPVAGSACYILDEHGTMLPAGVIGIPSPQWGETPLAVVVAKSGRIIDPEALRDWANVRLGKYQRISRIELRSSLPRGSLDKVMKRELQRLYSPRDLAS